MSDQRDLGPGETKEGWIQIENQGGNTWKSYGMGRLKMKSEALSNISVYQIAAKEEKIAPGETGTISFTFKAPEKEGNYVISLTPIVQNSALLSEAIKYRISVSNDHKNRKRIIADSSLAPKVI